jgi:F-type H+-transporting ATPase subunit a
MDIMDTVVPSVAFRVFGIPVRTSVISTWIMMAVVFVGIIVLRKKAPVVLEMLIDFISDLAGDFIPGSPRPYVPFLGTLFLFIAVANLFGIVPMMVTPTRDINTPLAMAIISLIASFAFGVYVNGVLGFLKSLASPLLPLDLIGYFSRTMSLTLRLFGNIIGGEIVVAVLFFLVPVGVPLIMVALGSITGLLQAYVFTVLTSSYIASTVESEA